MARIITYRGKDEETLKKMSTEEFTKLLTSRERRSMKRGMSDLQKSLLEKVRTSKKPVRTHCRSMIVLPDMIGKKIMIYSGKEWVPVDITIDMLGHRLGEFALTRKKVSHSAPGLGATKSSKFLPLK